MRTVTFLPSYRKIDVDLGTTILDAAQRAGLNMNVVCGGQGKCGKCVVFIQSGRADFDQQKVRPVLYRCRVAERGMPCL